MASIHNILSIAQSSLSASQSAIAVANNNVANVNTPGYAREVLSQSHGFGGLGVVTGSPTAIRNALMERSVAATRSRLGYFAAQNSRFNQLESITNDLDGTGLGVDLSRFEEAMTALSANPAGLSERTQVLQTAETLSSSFRSTRQRLQTSRNNGIEQAKSYADQANTMLSEIANLNGRMKTLPPGADSNALDSQRSELIQRVSNLVGVQVISRSDNTVHLQTAGGRPLVEGENATTLSVKRGAPPEQEPRLTFSRADGGALEAIGPAGGQIGGLLEADAESMRPAIERVDEIAYHFMEQFNSVHASGYDLNGQTGFDFFDLPDTVEGAAGAMAISRDVADLPEHIAASSTFGGVPGNNEGILALRNLIGQDGVLPNGMSVERAWTDLGNSVTRGLLRSTSGVGLESTSLEQLENMLASQQGVNLDEELIRISQANTALQAATQVMSQVQEMTDTLMTLVR